MLNVNTLVLGMRGSGKTCALSSMYAIMTYGVNYFSLTALDRKQKSLLNDYWKGMKNGYLPDASYDGQMFSLVCSHSFNPLCQVNWYDYPGGWTDMIHENREDLEEKMISADCIICCIPTDELVKAYKSKTYLECMQHYNDLFNFYGMHKTGTKYVPIVFMLTKFDLCKDKNLVKDAISDYIKHSPFGSKTAKWLTVVIPVTLGSNIKIYQNSEGKSCIDEATLEPEYIHLPIMFSICKKLSESLLNKINLMKEKKISISQIASAISEMENKFLVWNKDDKIALKNNSITNIKEELDSIISDADNITQNLELVRNELIEGIQLAYYKGEPCEINEVI